MSSAENSQSISDYPIARQVEHWSWVVLWRSRLHIAITMLIFIGVLWYHAAVGRLAPSEAAGLLLAPIVVYALTSTLLRSCLRFVESLFLPGEILRSKSDLFQHLIKKFGPNSPSLIRNMIRYRDGLRAVTWLATAGVLAISFFTASQNEIFFLTFVAAAINQLGIEIAESATLRIGIPKSQFEPVSKPSTSIDRGPLATPTIQTASGLIGIAHKLIAKDNERRFESPIIWGGLPIRDRQACNHFFIHGESGSGKSIVLKDLLIQAIRRAQIDGDQRILLDDPKGDMVEMLREINFDNYILINPFDERGFAWDIQKDLSTRTRVEDFAKLLVPSKNLSQPFFAEAARDSIEIVLNCFNQRASSWSLRDLVLAFRRASVFLGIAELTDQGRAFLENQTMNEKTFGNVLSETRNTIKKFESLAAACDAALQTGNRYSVHEFCSRKNPEQLWLLTRNCDAQGSIDLLCRLLLYFQDLEMKNWLEVQWPRSWAFIDEARLLADLAELSRIADQGRSKGLTLVLATQSHSDFVDSAKRNPEAASGVAERIPNKALFRCHGKDAKWSSDQFDEVYKKFELDGQSTNPSSDSKSFSSNEHIQKMPAVPPHVFKEMSAESDDEIEYYIVSDPRIAGGFWKARHKITTPFPKTDPDAKQRSREVLENLRPWTADDLERLGLTEIQSLFDFDEPGFNSDLDSKFEDTSNDDSFEEPPIVELDHDEGDNESDDDNDDDIRIPGVDF